MKTRLVLFVLAALMSANFLRAADTNTLTGATTNTFSIAAEFERADKLYWQGKFAEAALAYEGLVQAGATSANVWFNLGNANYKAGQLGRSIAAYRLAERLTPREAALRANLQFVRGKVYSDERTRVPWATSALRLATINEWTVLTVVGLWAFFAVLATGEITRRRYAKTAATLLVATLCGGVALGLALRDQLGAREAVVVAREVTARFGPLDESQAAFQLRDGAECAVIEVKGAWLQVRDPEKRTGWIHRDDTMVLPGANESDSRTQKRQSTN